MFKSIETSKTIERFENGTVEIRFDLKAIENNFLREIVMLVTYVGDEIKMTSKSCHQLLVTSITFWPQIVGNDSVADEILFSKKARND